MSLCKEKFSNIVSQQDIIEDKKDVDEICKYNNECGSGFCSKPPNCEQVLENTKLCETIKICQTSSNISKPENFK